jgi:hypothetical protein
MEFYKYIENCKWEDVQPVMLAICRQRGPKQYVEDRKKNVNGYDCFESVFDRLRHIKPAESDMSIQITVSDDDGVSVSCIQKNHAGLYGFLYPWDESLGMEIVFKDVTGLSDEEIVANCIWEMTYWGFSEEESRDFFKHR